MITQLDASAALHEWQRLRAIGVKSPDERIERLMAEFFLPPLDLDVRYQDQLKAVDEAMQEPYQIDWTVARDVVGVLALNLGAWAVIGIIGFEILRP